MPPKLLRNLPSVSELLEYPALKRVVGHVNPNVVVTRVRTFLDGLRHDLQTAAQEVPLPSVSELAERIVRRLRQDERPQLRPVINATGILLHPELGGPPLADHAIEEIIACGRDYASTRIDLVSASAARASAAVEELLVELCGCEAALIVNSHVSAWWLTLSALAEHRQVIISRGEVGDVEGSPLAELVSKAGAKLREAGSTHHTELSDFEQAFGSETGCLLRTEPTDYTIVGSTAKRPALEDLARLARKQGQPLVHDLGYGGLLGVAPLGLKGELTLPASLAAGSDVVLVSGDKLLGGPQSGLIVGRRKWIEQIAAHPLAGALSADKLTLSALAGTLRLSRQPELAFREIPLLRLLDTPAANLRGRAERLAPQLTACPAIRSAEVIEATTWLGPAQIESRQLPTWCVSLVPESGSADRLAAILRVGTPAVLPRVLGDRCCFDLRSVLPRQDMALIDAVMALSPAEPDKRGV